MMSVSLKNIHSVIFKKYENHENVIKYWTTGQ